MSDWPLNVLLSAKHYCKNQFRLEGISLTHQFASGTFLVGVIDSVRQSRPSASPRDCPWRRNHYNTTDFDSIKFWSLSSPGKLFCSKIAPRCFNFTLTLTKFHVVVLWVNVAAKPLLVDFETRTHLSSNRAVKWSDDANTYSVGRGECRADEREVWERPDWALDSNPYLSGIKNEVSTSWTVFGETPCSDHL